MPTAALLLAEIALGFEQSLATAQQCAASSKDIPKYNDLTTSIHDVPDHFVNSR